MSRSHVPVLASELIDLTAPAAGDVAVDCTFGAGGHARPVAERIGPAGMLVCVDRDPAAQERFDDFARDAECETRFLRTGYVEALRLLAGEGLEADVVVFDLGVSSMQVDARDRGFSYSYDAPLDMRMDPTRGPDAREIVNTLDERRLAQVLRRHGEEPNARAVAREIVRRRERAPFETTGELVEAIEAATPAAARRRFGGGHPAKRVFQAIRIVVNEELDELDAGLPEAWRLLRDGGRLAAISFHSLEDRRVKRFLADRARGCTCPPDFPVCVCGRTPEAELLTPRPVVPGADEVAENPRARSGRLRAARKLSDGAAG
jgi:16S rRNA (cytosine1402-N4)-methyltransferase